MTFSNWVFGSNVNRELWRSVKDCMVLVGIAALIGIPLAVWFCGRYLNRFAYRIEHFGWIIAVAAILGMLMAINNARLIAKPDDEWLKI